LRRPLAAAAPGLRLWRQTTSATRDREALEQLTLTQCTRQTLAAGAKVVGERFEVLHDGREVELVACAGKASQTHASKAMVDLKAPGTASRPCSSFVPTLIWRSLVTICQWRASIRSNTCWMGCERPGYLDEPDVRSWQIVLQNDFECAVEQF
jgi:hypothetical protein